MNTFQTELPTYWRDAMLDTFVGNKYPLRVVKTAQNNFPQFQVFSHLVK